MEAVTITGALQLLSVCFVVAVATAESDMIPVPPFQIRIILSDDAAQKLNESGETIKGAVYFDGDGTPKEGEETAPFRAVFLGSYNFELKKPGLENVSEAKISNEAFARLSDRNYHYTINVFSGRHVFKNNILRDGVAVGRIGDATKSPIEVRCTLAPPDHIR
jgi:hypothetical protein